MIYKVIFFGYFEFGIECSYQKMVDMFEYCFENYYCNVILFNGEEVFDEVF